MSARHSTSSIAPASSTMVRSCLLVLPKRWSPTRRSGAFTSARASHSSGGSKPMGLGPSLTIPQSQQLVLTPQLTQAIKLLQLSNLELEAYVAEELSKNPLLESRSDEDGDQPVSDFAGEESDSDEPPDEPGADNLILGQADD